MSRKKKNVFLDKVAQTISFFGSPFIVLVLMFAFLAWHYKEGVAQFYNYIIIVGLFVIIVPLAYILENVKKVRFIDLHIENREDRANTLIVTLLSVTMGYFMLLFLGIPKPLLLIEFSGMVNLLIITTITYVLKFKISIHLAIVTIVATLVGYLLGDAYLWLYLLLVPLAWARIYRQKHTIFEVLVGIFVSFVITLLVIQAFLRYG